MPGWRAELDRRNLTAMELAQTRLHLKAQRTPDLNDLDLIQMMLLELHQQLTEARETRRREED